MSAHPVLAVLKRSIIAFSGHFGSGKSEVAVNVALGLAARGDDVAIVDLDLVNPYFRCREARTCLEEAGVNVIAPQGEYESADLPILLPEIKGRLARQQGVTILDVGGDDLGARALRSLRRTFEGKDFHLLLVLNGMRPFTADLSSCLATLERIAVAAGLSFTGLVGNTHLMADTTEDTVVQGALLAQEVSSASSLPVLFVTSPAVLAEDIQRRVPDIPVLPLRRQLRPPWLTGSSMTCTEPVPGRPWGSAPRIPVPSGSPDPE